MTTCMERYIRPHHSSGSRPHFLDIRSRRSWQLLEANRDNAIESNEKRCKIYPFGRIHATLALSAKRHPIIRCKGSRPAKSSNDWVKYISCYCIMPSTLAAALPKSCKKTSQRTRNIKQAVFKHASPARKLHQMLTVI